MCCLQVDVLQARNLQKKEGLLGTVDPQIELYTQPQHRVRTAPKSRTSHPSWGQQGQRIELLVQVSMGAHMFGQQLYVGAS